MGGSLSSQKKQELLRDIQDWISILDHTVYNLAKTIDVMEASAKVVVCHLDDMILDKKEIGTAESYSNDKKYQRMHDTAKNLLDEIKSTVEHQKLYTLDTFINFINKGIYPLLDKYKVTSSDIKFSPQKIDMYLGIKRSTTAHNSQADKASTLEVDTHHFREDNKKKRDREAKVQCEDKQVQTLQDPAITETDEEKKLKLENMHLKQEKNAIESDSSKLSTECSELRTDLDKIKASEQLLQEEMSRQKKIIEERDTQIYDLKNQIQLLENKVSMLKETNNVVDQQLQTLKNKKVLQVQLFCQPRGGVMSTVEEELMLNLKKKYGDDNIKIKCIQCVKTTDVKPDIPLLVLCITASRLGTDVTNILQGLKLTSKVSMLVFHHKDVHALPNQASDRVLSGPEFEHIGGIFDMAFLSAKGIYSCGMNDNGFINILNFLDKEGTLTREC